MAEDNQAGKIIGAFVIGGLVGAALGILFAPKAGKETRKDIADWMDETYEKSKHKLEAMGEELKHRKDQLAQAFNKKEA